MEKNVVIYRELHEEYVNKFHSLLEKMNDRTSLKECLRAAKEFESAALRTEAYGEKIKGSC